MTQYIIVRADLPLGMIAAQVAHAAGAGSDRHPPGVHVVVLSVPSEDALLVVSARLVEAEVAQTLVVETDDPYAEQAMSIGLELIRDRSETTRILSSLPLLRALVGSQKDSHQTEASSADDLPSVSVGAAQHNQVDHQLVEGSSMELGGP